MAGTFEQQADGHLDRRIVIHHQYPCQSKKFSALRWNQSTTSREFSRIAMSLQLFHARERSSPAVKMPVKALPSACWRADKSQGGRVVVIRQVRRAPGNQLLRYSG